MNKAKIVNLIFILFPLLSVVAAILWMIMTVPTFYYEVTIVLIFLLVIIPLAIIAGGIFTAWKSFKALRKGKGLLSKKELLPSLGYSFILLESLFSISIAGMIVGALFNDRPPQFFPFDDQQATYTVEKKDNWFYVVYDSPSDKNSSFSCGVDLEVGKEFCRTDIQHHVEVIVGKSPVDLESLLDKSVKLDGEFVNGNKQCIVNKCIDIGNYAVLNISSIQLKDINSVNNWKNFDSKEYSFEYPSNWSVNKIDYLSTVKIESPEKSVAINISEGQYPYSFEGPAEATPQTQTLSVMVNGKSYQVMENTRNKRTVYTDFEINTPKHHHILFGSGYPAAEDNKASLPDYQKYKPILLTIISTLKLE